MCQYGYVRVSLKDQNPDRQLAALQEQGISPGHIFLDKISGKNFQRTAYQSLKKKIRKGDRLVIKSIDRLGRNYSEILEEWRMITREIGAFIADLVLQILAYVAETERSIIHSRQSEEIALAKAKGVQFGRQKKEVPEEFPEYYRLWACGEITLRQTTEKLKMSSSTFYRKCKEQGKNCHKR